MLLCRAGVARRRGAVLTISVEVGVLHATSSRSVDHSRVVYCHILAAKQLMVNAGQSVACCSLRRRH